MLIGITKKLDEKLNIGINKLPDIIPNDIYCWHANFFVWKRRNCIVFINDKTRFHILLYGVKKEDVKNLSSLFYKQLITNLKGINLHDLYIKKYLSGNDKVYFTKTTNRSVTGSLKDTIHMLSYDMDNFCSEGYLLQDDLNNHINQYVMIPLTKLGLPAFPDKAMKNVLEQLDKSGIN